MKIQVLMALTALTLMTAAVAANAQVRRPSAAKAAPANLEAQAGTPKAPAGAAQGGVCSALSSMIEAGEKELAKIDAEDIGDNSAPRASVRANKKVYVATMISNNLGLMREHHCAPYPRALSDAAYMLPAMTCRTAMVKLETRIAGDATTKVELPDECDESKWTRLGDH
jgi:hypothetical protein